MTTPKTPKPEAEKAPAAVETPITRVLTNFEVEDNSTATGAIEEKPVEETARKLDSGLTQVDYV